MRSLAVILELVEKMFNYGRKGRAVRKFWDADYRTGFIFIQAAEASS